MASNGNYDNYYPIVINQGATWNLNVEYRDETNLPVDLTGYSAKMQLRTSPLAAVAELTLSTMPNGGITISPLTGIVYLTATAVQTAGLKPQKYSYDLDITNPVTGVVTRLIQGVVNVIAGTTR